ncbi:hypothetical protein AAFP35_25390 [Gordonia sp. CPCC 206044]|uniref:MlaD family protein n=1 Tax=Gordonia sp. CPCC 206044 TaxID=3140793 RepID=UPI003AF3DA8E
MAKHILTGVNTEQRSARIIGFAFLIVVVLGLTAWRVMPDDDSADDGIIDVTFVTESVGAGVEKGTEVWRHGVKVGSVSSVERRGDAEYVTVGLAGQDVTGVTDGLSIAYAPANLFGITQISLKSSDGGNPLRDGTTIDLTGSAATRVEDATMSTLLDGLGRITDRVLTPKLAELVDKVARNSKEFTPMMQMLVGVAATVWQTQRMPLSPIIQGFGDGLKGLPPTLTGVLNLLDVVYRQPYLKSPENRKKFDATTGMLANGVIPGVAGMLREIRPYYQDLAMLPPPVLGALARSVGSPAVTERNLREVLDRVSGSFRNSPAGPVLRLALELDVAASPEGQGPGR